MKRLDLTGHRFGRWTVVSMAPPRCDGKHIAWHCRCDCGQLGIATTLDLRNGDSRSCGCLRREASGAKNRTHGLTDSAEYRAWCKMKERCYVPGAKEYDRYGGRGITICDEWRYDFERFYADMGKRPSAKHSIDRIDNDLHYTPRNCRWATRHQQMRNLSRNRWLTHPDGRRMIISDWTRTLGFSRQALPRRLQRGWSEHDALTTPLQR